MATLASKWTRTAALLVAVACLLAATAEAATRRTRSTRHLHQKLKMVHENVRRVRALQARGPQPRAVQVVGAMELKPSEKVDPSQTVLHRCDENACCGLRNLNTHQCVPRTEEVPLLFMVTDVSTNKIRILEQTFRNHTKCDCVRKEVGP